MNRFIFTHLGLHRLNPQSLGNERVADLGCGIGAVSRFGSGLFPQIHFDAMTISAGQIAEARRRHKNENVEYHCGDYHSLPLGDASCSGVFFLESLCHSTRPEVVLGEVARVLKVGGRVVMTDGFLTRPLNKTSHLFQTIVRAVANNWAVPMFHEIELARQWNANGKLKLVEDIECGWRLGPSALHAAHLSLIQFFKLAIKRDVKPWQWKHLKASAFTIVLGLYRRNFRYHLLVFERVK